MDAYTRRERGLHHIARHTKLCDALQARLALRLPVPLMILGLPTDRYVTTFVEAGSTFSYRHQS